MHHISRTFYPGPSLNKADGELEWPAGWSLERYKKAGLDEVLTIPQGVKCGVIVV